MGLHLEAKFKATLLHTISKAQVPALETTKTIGPRASFEKYFTDQDKKNQNGEATKVLDLCNIPPLPVVDHIALS